MISFNIMLDPLPEYFEGFLIDTDFRTGIKLLMMMQDAKMTRVEKTMYATGLLFLPQKEMPDLETAIRGVEWFLTAWNMDKPGKSGEEKEKNVPLTDFNVDQWRIFAAFLAQYGIDLNTAEMHFWVFMGLFSCLEESAYTRVVDIRQMKIPKKLSASEKKKLLEMKERYALEDPAALEEEAEMKAKRDAFLKKWEKR